MADQRLRQLERQAADGDIEAQARLGMELKRALDVVALVSGLGPQIKAAIAESTLAASMAEAAAERIATSHLDTIIEGVAEQFDASDIAGYIEIDTYDIAQEVADTIEPSEVAEHIDACDVASYVDLSEVADNIEIDLDDLASKIDLDDLASKIDLDDLATRLPDPGE